MSDNEQNKAERKEQPSPPNLPSNPAFAGYKWLTVHGINVLHNRDRYHIIGNVMIDYLRTTDPEKAELRERIEKLEKGYRNMNYAQDKSELSEIFLEEIRRLGLTA